MISQHSTNPNKVSFGKMLAEALRRGNWMIALSVLANFLAGPVCFLFVLQSYESNYSVSDYAADRAAALLEISEELAQNMADYLTGLHATLQLIVVIVGAFIVSVFGFRYLYHRRSADLCDSMPVSRGRRFLAQYLAGFLIWFVPFLIGNLFILLIGLFRVNGSFGVYATAMLKIFLLMIFHFLIVYNACLVAVQLSGNTINALLNSVLYGILAITVYGIFYLYGERFLDNFYAGSVNLPQLFFGLSPLAAPIAQDYLLLDENAAEYLLLPIVSGIMMIADFFLAKWLHSRRPSELAEHGLECKPVQILLRGIVSVGTGLLLGMFFDVLSSTGNSTGWIVFGCIFGTILAFAVLNVIYHATFRELFAHKIQMAVCVVLAGAIMVCFHRDLFGYDTYVAFESRITGLAIGSSALYDDGYTLIWDEDDQRYHYTYSDAPAAVVSTDASEIHRILEVLADNTREKSGNSLALNVRVSTKTGSYYRTYRVYRSDTETLAPLLETDAFRDTYYPASMGSLITPESLEAYSLDNVYCEINDSEKMQALYEAYQADFLEHYCADLILSEAQTLDNVRLDFNGNGYFPSLTVYPCFTRTLTLLEEWYPEQAWILDDTEIIALAPGFSVEASTGEGSVEAMLDALGVSEEVRADLSDLITEAKNAKTWTDWWTTGERITDPDLIAQMTPYLSTSDYSEASEMTDFGYVYVQTDAYEYDENILWISVEKGKVPAEVIELLLEYYLNQ